LEDFELDSTGEVKFWVSVAVLVLVFRMYGYKAPPRATGDTERRRIPVVEGAPLSAALGVESLSPPPPR